MPVRVSRPRSNTSFEWILQQEFCGIAPLDDGRVSFDSFTEQFWPIMLESGKELIPEQEVLQRASDLPRCLGQNTKDAVEKLLSNLPVTQLQTTAFFPRQRGAIQIRLQPGILAPFFAVARGDINNFWIIAPGGYSGIGE
jgi:hypothetical protein